MKTIIIMRHGKAEDYSHSKDDKHRSLVDIGREDAHLVGRFLHERNIIPQIILTSDATRADQTARCIAEEINFPTNKIIHEPFIYNGYTTEIMIEYINNNVDNTADCMLIVGHNPDIAYAAGNMSNTQISHFPTAACVIFDFNAEKWTDIHSREGEIRLSVTPKSLKFNGK